MHLDLSNVNIQTASAWNRNLQHCTMFTDTNLLTLPFLSYPVSYYHIACIVILNRRYVLEKILQL